MYNKDVFIQNSKLILTKPTFFNMFRKKSEMFHWAHNQQFILRLYQKIQSHFI